MFSSIGDIDTLFHKTNVEYIPIIKGEKNFYINIPKIQIGEKIINNKYRGFIDSGTTVSYFPNDLYNAIIDEFKSVCGKKDKKCGKFRDVSDLGYCGFFNTIEDKEKAINEYWPNITFYFEGHYYILTAKDYNYDYNDNQIGACLGFEGEYASKITLGGTFMHGHDIIFDKGNQKIGFAVADCNRNNIMSKNNYNKANNNNYKNKLINNEKILYLSIIFEFLLLLVIIFIIIKKCISKNKNRHHAQIDEISNSENN